VPELSFRARLPGRAARRFRTESTNGTWAAAIRSLAALSNVTCKLCGVHTRPARASGLRPYYETVLAAFGPDRLMFGSDWPVSTFATTYGRM